MNTLSYLLGVLYFIKVLIRWRSPTLGQRWNAGESIGGWRDFSGRIIPFFLGSGSVFLLVLGLIHCLNYRAEFDATTLTFNYREGIVPWLPHSYEASLSWAVFYRNLALCLGFWATRDWLLGISQRDLRRFDLLVSKDALPGKTDAYLTQRVQLLLVTLLVSGSVLAFVGILQRLDESQRLLWIYEPKFNKESLSNFGSFAYRGNAATYFNLIIPLGVALCAALLRNVGAERSDSRFGSNRMMLCLPLMVILLVAPFQNSSRVGAGVFVLEMLACLFVWIRTIGLNRSKLLSFGVLTGLITLVLILVGDTGLIDRLRLFLEHGLEGPNHGRLEIYRHFGEMYRDLPFWGFGPGTFSTVYVNYRLTRLVHWGSSNTVNWSAWAHCDPFEMLLTYGWVGTVVILGMLLALLGMGLFSRGGKQAKGFQYMLVIAVFGFCLHSVVDFPFHVYSLNHQFLVVAAILTVLPLIERSLGRGSDGGLD
jgi:hypothetical protein